MALFTAETAVIAAKLSHAPDSARNRKPEPQPQPAIVLAPADSYATESLARTRKQLDKLRDWLDNAEDAKDADAITRAIERLAKLECYLANRPGPGNYKPTAPRQSRDRAPIAPVEVPAPQSNPPENTP